MASASNAPWSNVGGSAAEEYQRVIVPAMMAPLAPALIELAQIGNGDAVLDVACGTGVVTQLVAKRVGASGRVVGLDLNAAMLGIARSLPSKDIVPVEWIEASAQAMPFPDAVFDAVVCQHGLQQFPDRPLALSEMRRVLKPGGRMAVSVWAGIEQNPAMAALVDALARHVGEAAAQNRRAPFRLDDKTLFDLLAAANLRDVRAIQLSGHARFASPEQFVNAQLGATPLATLGTLSEDAHRAVVSDVTSALAHSMREDHLVVPILAHAGFGRT